MLKQWRLALILLTAMALGLVISACGSTDTGSSSTPTATTASTPTTSATTPTPTLGTPGAYTCETGTLTASGSTALQPLVQAVATKYQAKCSGANITVGIGGSGTGLTNAENGTSDIGNSDIFSKTGQEDLVDHQVAVVVFTLVINSKVTGVTNLTTAQLKGIYSGQIKNWSAVNGPNLPIVVVSRPTSSGTRATFQKYVLGTVETVTGPSNLTTDSTGTVIKNVQQTDGAIGYAASGPAKKAGLTILQIDGTDATAANVETNTYKFWNIEHMYTKGAAKPIAQALIDYMLSDDGKAAAQSLDFVAISDVPQTALQTHETH